MRPFGCLVTILNTLDPLGSGPTWLFDIDTLTKSMNYQLVTADNQSNPSAGVQEQFDAKKAGEENVQQYFERRKPGSEVHVSPSSSAKTKKHDDKTKREAKGKSLVVLSTRYINLSAEFEYFFDNNINEVNAASTPVPAVGQISSNNTNPFSAAGPSDTAVSPTLEESSYVDPSQYHDDPNMPALEDITYSDDEEDVGAEADFSNWETSITVSPIPTTRVHKDHHVTQIIGDLSISTQIKSMTRMVKDQGGLTQINNEDFHTCMFACFLSQEEPKRMDVKSAFLYGTIKEEVYVCQPPGFEDPNSPEKIYIVVKELYGLHQAPRAWYETLANYLLENGFQRGKIDQTWFIKKQKGDIVTPPKWVAVEY
uniref:Putative ribonuclease H-like domain-containing protein n=1 Tax=Tanacetum cinerariifolium TaxID=118510 RepID=A0A699KZK5_TANCI|nr:putative ribonuclease H-like domain-containing protein [Tanacetum cinerariifolium]